MSPSDGGGILNRSGNVGSDDNARGKAGRDGNDGNEGNDGSADNAGNTGNCFPTGSATGTGMTIGPFFKLLRMVAALAILAILSAFRNLIPANLRASAVFALRNGAVIILTAATFAAFACGLFFKYFFLNHIIYNFLSEIEHQN